ncbi:hypothetical protein F5Y04DRAFT_288166 [Hypomontagnella monticulosa]|nr:hypothetical protein F5Y04DRAFT_288166 [Hypomontagnella monticulosa]
MSCLQQLQQKGTPIRDCDIVPWELPDIDDTRRTLDNICLRAFDWSYPRVWPQEPIKANTYLRNLDEFLHALEKSRQEGTFDQWKANTFRQDFLANSNNYIYRVLAEIAQLRAELICFLLVTRVSPVLHQDMLDRMNAPDTRYERRQLPTDRARFAKKVVGAFWGDKHSGNPLPMHVRMYMGISDYAGWAERVDDKLLAMARKLHEEPRRIRDLF